MSNVKTVSSAKHAKMHKMAPFYALFCKAFSWEHAPSRQIPLPCAAAPAPPASGSPRPTLQAAYNGLVCVSVPLFLSFAVCMFFSVCMSHILHIGRVDRNHFCGRGPLEKQILQPVHLNILKAAPLGATAWPIAMVSMSLCGDFRTCTAVDILSVAELGMQYILFN